VGGAPVTPGPGAVALLAAMAFAGGVVDAIAGGGGLLTLPALAAAGLPPHLVIGTNKGQSVFGALSALFAFARAGLVERRRALASFPAAAGGAVMGGLLVLALRPEVVRPLILVLLVAVAAFVGLRRGAPRPGARVPARWLLPVAAGWSLLIGAYDGFFGPGTGTFLIVGFVALLGDSLTGASAAAKVANFASNLAALAVFAWRGQVAWQLALPMAAAQLLGGQVGARLAVKGGDALVRRVVLLVVLALCVKLGLDAWRGGDGLDQPGPEPAEPGRASCAGAVREPGDGSRALCSPAGADGRLPFQAAAAITRTLAATTGGARISAP
jgi:uncharacterized membrane protein YfcA